MSSEQDTGVMRSLVPTATVVGTVRALMAWQRSKSSNGSPASLRVCTVVDR